MTLRAHHQLNDYMRERRDRQLREYRDFVDEGVLLTISGGALALAAFVALLWWLL